MNIQKFHKPSHAIQEAKRSLFEEGNLVKTEKWQGVDSPDDMWEYLNFSFCFDIPGDISILEKEIKPNLPWAQNHFLERIGGKPINPGKEYKNWPFYIRRKENDKFRKEKGKFSHSYMERIWSPDRMGIRYNFGNMYDLLDLLEREPFTRQAFLPIWFPEDTGVKFKDRVPCTIGYHFIRRDNKLNVIYYIRSCDILRHFRDDIYLSCRKVIWIIDQLRKKSEKWGNVIPGEYIMHITSLHCFNSEKNILRLRNK